MSARKDLKVGSLTWNQTFPFKQRSVNAFTIEDPIHNKYMGGKVFVKAAMIDANADPIYIDAANGLIMSALDPQGTWTVPIRGINRCFITSLGQSTAVTIAKDNDTTSNGIAISYANLDHQGGLFNNKVAPQLEDTLKSVRILLAKMVGFSIQTGFQHDDVHVQNVLMCNDGKLRVIDYGRVMFSPQTLRSHESQIRFAFDLAGKSTLGVSYDSFMRNSFDPFSNLGGLRIPSNAVWIPDLIMLTTWVCTMLYPMVLSKIQNLLIPPFLRLGGKIPSVPMNITFSANFSDPADLSAKLDRFDDRFGALAPGLLLMAIVLRYEPGALKSNYSMTHAGGRAIARAFSDGTMKSYTPTIKRAFEKAGQFHAFAGGRKITSFWDLVAPVFARPAPHKASHKGGTSETDVLARDTGGVGFDKSAVATGTDFDSGADKFADAFDNGDGSDDRIAAYRFDERDVDVDGDGYEYAEPDADDVLRTSAGDDIDELLASRIPIFPTSMDEAFDANFYERGTNATPSVQRDDDDDDDDYVVGGGGGGGRGGGGRRSSSNVSPWAVAGTAALATAMTVVWGQLSS